MAKNTIATSNSIKLLFIDTFCKIAGVAKKGAIVKNNYINGT